MATINRKISKSVVDSVQPDKRDILLRDPELKGFGLKVSPSGGKSYFLEFRMGGRGAPKGRISIGKHGSPWTPDKARDRAKELLELVRRGINPVVEKEERNRLAVDLAFRKYADLFIDRYAKHQQARSWQQAQRLLDRDIKPVLKDRPIHEISRREIKRLLEDIADRAPALARYAHATLRKLFRWAVDRGDIELSPMAEMAPPAPAISRDRVLSDDEVSEVWWASLELTFPFGPMVRLLIATGQRRNEVSSIRWQDIDLEAKLWTIPAENAKNGKAHLVPLNALAVEVLKSLPIEGAKPKSFVFTTTGETAPSGWSKAKARLDKQILERRKNKAKENGQDPETAESLEPWKLHDLRRTMATGMQKLGIRLEVTEAVLNHVSGSRAGIVGIYQRHSWSEEKRTALKAWSKAIRQMTEASTDSANNVVRLNSELHDDRAA